MCVWYWHEKIITAVGIFALQISIFAIASRDPFQQWKWKPTRIGWMENAFIWFWYFHFFARSIPIICIYSRFFSIFNRFMFFDDSIWLVMLKMSIKCMNTHCVCIRILQPPSTLLTIYRRSHFQESRRDQMNIKIMKLIIKKIDDITAEKHSIKRATRPISQIIGIYWKLMSTPTKKNHHQPSQKKQW